MLQRDPPVRAGPCTSAQRTCSNAMMRVRALRLSLPLARSAHLQSPHISRRGRMVFSNYHPSATPCGRHDIRIIRNAR